MQIELNNLNKIKTQLQERLISCDKLNRKLQNLNDKFTFKDIENLNSVMMINVQIKHTSQFILNLGLDYFAEVKYKSTIDFLQRKRKNLQASLKNVSHKITTLTDKISKNKVNCQQKKIDHKPLKSQLQVIGQNQNGQSIFNIIQTQEEQFKNTQNENIQSNQELSNINLNKIIQQSPQEDTQTNQQNDLLYDYDQNSYSSSQEDDKKSTQQNKILPKAKGQTKQIKKQGEHIKKVQINNPIVQTKIQTKAKQNCIKQTKGTKQKKSDDRSDRVNKEQDKKISKFKLQRMKQKLDEQL